MNDSFVFYKSFADTINEIENPLQQLACYKMLMQIAFSEEEVNVNELPHDVKMVYFIASQQIQASIKNKTNGAKGGRPRKTENSKTPLLTPVNSNDNVNVNVNDNVKDNVNVFSKQNTPVTEILENKSNTVPDTTTEPMKNFGSSVYNEFVNAGLPHEKSLIDFLFGGLKTGCEIIHHNEESKRATSQEILQAVKNYIDVLNDTKCFYSVKHSFVSFCKSEQFYKFLPSNFVKDNWYSYETKKEAATSKVNNKTDFNFQNIKYIDTECPNCKNKTLYLDDALNSYMCTTCKRILDNLTTE